MTIFKSFREGFLGSFQLAAALVMAVIAVSSAFVNQAITSGGERAGDRSART